MQERLEKWRQNTLSVPSAEKLKGQTRRPSKGDKGDVESLEEWEEERKRSQRRK